MSQSKITVLSLPRAHTVFTYHPLRITRYTTLRPIDNMVPMEDEYNLHKPLELRIGDAVIMNNPIPQDFVRAINLDYMEAEDYKGESKTGSPATGHVEYIG